MWHCVAYVYLLTIAVFGASPALARAPASLCPAGRYLVEGDALAPGSQAAPDVVVIAEDGSGPSPPGRFF